jgi:UDP-N-acetylmuramyl pentapeptide phosphotransferase/UDP-N-acetylglucosamine-1-phosphate transferase
MYISIIILCIASFLATFVMKRIAIKQSIIDTPHSQSLHSAPTPKAGGLAIAVTWYIYIFCFFLSGTIDKQLFYALLPGIFIVLTGFIDDIKGVSPIIRIAVYILASIIGLTFLGGLGYFDFATFHFKLHWTVNILVVVGMVWAIILFNFLDNIDGYLGSEGILIFFSFFLFTGNMFALAFAACILGFLYWNWPKARIFCGDTGSTLIGYTFIIFALYYQNKHQLSLIVPIILSGLFWMDGSLTLFRRWKNKEKLNEKHSKHATQRLVQSGFSHHKVLIIGIFINGLLILDSYFALKYPEATVYAIVLQIAIVYGFIRFADKRKAF